MRRSICVALVIVGTSILSATVATNAFAAGTLAPTPPMGWNSYNAYACDNSAQDMEAVGRFLHSSGLQADGYHYVNADGCYDDLEGLDSPNTYAVNAPARLDPETCGAINGRLPDGQLYVNSYLFPASRPCANDGFALVARRLHGLGLGLGLYLDASNNWNCEEIPGSDGFDTTDADTLAGWGVDYVKADWGCGDSTQAPGSNAPAGYSGIDAAPGNTGFGGPTFSTNPAYAGDQESTQIKMYTALGQALKASGRPILYSIAGAGTIHPEQWGLGLGEMARPTPDANANFTATGRQAAGSIVGIVNADAEQYAGLTGPDHWIDPDIMEVGNGSLTATEDQSEMSMFSEMADPLIMSTNLCPGDCGPDTTPATPSQLALDVSVFGNRGVVAVDQDRQGSPAHTVGSFDGTHLVMDKPLSGGDVAVTLFNEGTTTAATMSTTTAALGLSGSGPYRLQNLWTGATTTTTGPISADVPATGTVMYRVSPVSQPAWRPGRTQTGRIDPRATSARPGTAPRGGWSPSGVSRRPGNLLSLACPTAGQCTSVDELGDEVTFAPAAPSRSRQLGIDLGHTLVAVACPAGRECVAVDRDGRAGAFDPTTYLPRGGASTIDAGGEPTAVSCPQAEECVAVDGHGTEVTFDPARPGGGVVHRSAVDPGTYLGAVSCPSSTQCTATGGGGNGSDSVVSFDPANGTIIGPGPGSIDPATGNGLSSVSCPTTAQCTAADGSGNEVTFDPAAQTVNAAGVVPLEGPTVAAAEGVFNGVSCASQTQCTAVDADGNEVTFDPASGTVNAAGVRAIDPAGNGLQAVACQSAQDSCTAIDLDGREVTFTPSTGATTTAPAQVDGGGLS